MGLTRDQWASHLEEWRQSGETATEYCASQGLRFGSFRYWIGRIRQEEGGVASAEESSAAPGSEVRFAAVRRLGGERDAPDARLSPAGVRVHLGGAEVEVDCLFDEAVLRSVLRVLKSLEGER